MEDIRKLLPIGSVVILKNAKKKVMIMGVKQRDLNTGHVFDYTALLYPEGFINKNSVFYVMHDAIETVFFRGYEDEEREQFVKMLEEHYSKKEDKE